MNFNLLFQRDLDPFYSLKFIKYVRQGDICDIAIYVDDIEHLKNEFNNTLTYMKLKIRDLTSDAECIIPESISSHYINLIKYGKFYMIKKCLLLSDSLNDHIPRFYATFETTFIEMKKNQLKNPLPKNYEEKDFLVPRPFENDEFCNNIDSIDDINIHIEAVVKTKSLFVNGYFFVIFHDPWNSNQGEIRADIIDSKMTLYEVFQEGRPIKIENLIPVSQNNISFNHSTRITPLNIEEFKCNLNAYANIFNKCKNIDNLTLLKKSSKFNGYLKFSQGLNRIINVLHKDDETFQSLIVGHLYNLKCDRVKIISDQFYYEATGFEASTKEKYWRKLNIKEDAKTIYSNTEITPISPNIFQCGYDLLKDRCSFIARINQTPLSSNQQSDSVCVNLWVAKPNQHGITQNETEEILIKCFILGKYKETKFIPNQKIEVNNAKIDFENFHFIIDDYSLIKSFSFSYTLSGYYSPTIVFPSIIYEFMNGNSIIIHGILNSKINDSYKLVDNQISSTYQRVIFQFDNCKNSGQICEFIGHDITIFNKLKVSHTYYIKICKLALHNGKYVFSIDDGEITEDKNPSKTPLNTTFFSSGFGTTPTGGLGATSTVRWGGTSSSGWGGTSSSGWGA
ncbi:hypothetical protein TRFO_10513 [Tritrichomonas foetus]|uniref:Uncharacterized protein n=1 Tax=Tritrichomonas foetus TaxID=1144522 RepID=A0A1J4J873_9EUKA|nr:hypothetical protein TRFO_10513 [Tritrichomonas foetus]|eukprot:OHS95382.1 hypothetical protein TRFO_10513 [Tritrichomonas foetus]